jgi:hypothetical protein
VFDTNSVREPRLRLPLGPAQSCGASGAEFDRRALPSDRCPFEACAAEYRAALVWSKWNRGRRAALGANRAGFGTRAGRTRGAAGLALLAVLGIVSELFCVKESLLVGGEDKVFPANDTLQYPIREFHLRLSDAGVAGGRKKRTGGSLADRQNQTHEFKTGARAAPDK